MAGTPDPRVGTDLGPYRIEAVIGRGGMGVVYRAMDTSLDRPVALKLIAPLVADDEAFQSRFLRESKMAAAIDHPNILPIYEAGEADGTFFLAMRFVDGTDLERRLRDGPLEPQAAVAILGQVAKALDAAHARGLVHRDVKPANVLLDPAAGGDEGDHAYLTDFGLTKQSGSETGLTRAGGFVGTLEYISPEQIEGRAVDGPADQYALAAIAVACLTGQVPFPRDSDVAIINAHLHDSPPSLRERVATLPAAADAVIGRGLAKAPGERYPDCRTFTDDLAWVLGVSSTRPAIGRPPGKPADRRLVAVVGALLGIGLLAVVAVAMASSGAGAPAASPSPSLAAASPTKTSDPSPTEDVFPNQAEAKLLALMPAALAASCVRGPYELVSGDERGGVPIASLSCPQDVETGASELVLRQFEYPEPGAGTRFFNPDTVVSGFIARGRIPAGDCASTARAAGRWQLNGQDKGAIVCLSDGATDDALLYWSHQEEGVLGKATNKKGDWAALYAWFEQNAQFIAP